jgi:phytoene dehydrogenase-like protein
VAGVGVVTSVTARRVVVNADALVVQGGFFAPGAGGRDDTCAPPGGSGAGASGAVSGGVIGAIGAVRASGASDVSVAAGASSTASTGDNRARGVRPSCGVVSLNFAFDIELSPLAHHTLFISQHYRDSWRAVEDPDTDRGGMGREGREGMGGRDAPAAEGGFTAFNSTAFNFYVHAPSRTDRSACPPGTDAVTVLVPVPPLPPDSTYAGSGGAVGGAGDGVGSGGRGGVQALYDVSLIRSAVLARLQEMPGMPDRLSERVLHCHVRDPVVWGEEFNLHKGAAFGLSHPLSQLALFRPPIRDPRIQRAYRVG